MDSMVYVLVPLPDKALSADVLIARLAIKGQRVRFVLVALVVGGVLGLVPHGLV